MQGYVVPESCNHGASQRRRRVPMAGARLQRAASWPTATRVSGPV
ncbi:hypothetical protein ACVOMV_23630 [Mesorhizobium atlanticum]